MKTRGYNQAEHIAKGIAIGMEKELNTNSLYRRKATETQTKKSKFARWQNVIEIFDVKDTHQINNKHILLVDDVVTTGATIESCVQKLLAVEGVVVSVACLAFPQ